MSKVKNSRNAMLYPNATDIKSKAHNSTVTFDVHGSEIDLNKVRRNSMVSGCILPGNLTGRNHHMKHGLGRMTHNSSVFSSQMDYNRSMISARLA